MSSSWNTSISETHYPESNIISFCQHKRGAEPPQHRRNGARGPTGPKIASGLGQTGMDYLLGPEGIRR